MRVFSVLLFTMAVVATCLGQVKKNAPIYDVDFSGRWQLISASREIANSQMAADPNEEMDLLVTQAGDELKVHETTKGVRGKFSREATYYLDGRGESNKGFTDGVKYESKTLVKKQKLNIEATVSFPNAKDTSYRTEGWSLSKDGKTLTIRTRSVETKKRNASTLFFDQSIREVFRLRRVS